MISRLSLLVFLIAPFAACVDGGQDPLSACANGRLDTDETWIDCGGICGLCPGASCVDNAMCASGKCMDGRCLVATCSDGLRNGDEQGVDCGGAQCGECGEADVTDGGPGDVDTDDVGVSVDAGPDRDGTDNTMAPVIDKVWTTRNRMSMRQRNGKLVIEVIVSHPRGMSAIAGGTLKRPGGGTYGTFTSMSNDGHYYILLTLADILALSPIDNSPAGGTSLPLIIEFLDDEGNSAVHALQIGVDCDDKDDGICGGRCFDFSDGSDRCSDGMSSWECGGFCGNCETVVQSNDECRGGVPACEYDVAPLPTTLFVHGTSVSLGYQTSAGCSSSSDMRYPLKHAFRYTAKSGEWFTASIEQDDVLPSNRISVFLREPSPICVGPGVNCAYNDRGMSPMSLGRVRLEAGETIILTFLTDVYESDVNIPFVARIEHALD